MLKLYCRAKGFFTRKQEEGASLVEYGLLVGLIACVCIVAITATGTSISAVFTRISGKLANVAT